MAIGLMGTYEHSLDEKGRVNFPAKLRDSLGERFIITQSPVDDCLFVYSEAEWELLEARIQDLPPTEVRDIQYVLFSAATDVTPDKQGRVVLPQKLRNHANLVKDVVIIGASSHAEIWDKNRWNERYDAITPAIITAAKDKLRF